MKNKSFTVILILLIIIAVHAVILYFVFKKDHKETLPADAKETAQAVERKGAEPEKKVKKHENPLFGKFFTYKNAVNGDIAGIPDSKNATSGILVDLGTRNVLWAKNPRKAVPIASMTKMMTVLLAMEAIDNGAVTMETPVKVTASSMKIGGSQVYLDTKETFPMRELLKSVAIKSANDSAQLVAEHLGNGDVAMFVENMNKRAKELKFPNTRFFNPHGLPEDNPERDNVSSPEALAFLAEHLLDYPQVVQWASTWSEPFREKGDPHYQIMTNHNHLVNECPGVDGMKTGWIKRSGFCTTVTCKRAGKRLVAVVTGFQSRKERDAFVKKLLDWGYRQNIKMPAGGAVSEEKEDAPAAAATVSEPAATPASKTSSAATSKTSSSTSKKKKK